MVLYVWGREPSTHYLLGEIPTFLKTIIQISYFITFEAWTTTVIEEKKIQTLIILLAISLQLKIMLNAIIIKFFRNF